MNAQDVVVETVEAGTVVRPPDPGDDVLLFLPPRPDTGPDDRAVVERAAEYARRCAATVLICRYRPAFTQALADAGRGYRYCQTLGRVSVLGERIGGSLTGSLLLWLRDWGMPAPERAVLVSAPLDLTLRANSAFLNDVADRTWTVEEAERQVAAYAGSRPRTDEMMSPLKANLHGLPPLLLLVAGNNLFLDDSLAFAARAARSGVDVQLKVWSETPGLREGMVGWAADFLTGPPLPAARPV